jgi:ABC-type transport system involved in multi-copper enzyme maturation permease subunit
MTTPDTPYRSKLPTGRDGFAQLLHAEWTKFRTVRGWVITTIVAVLLVILFAWLATFHHENEVICPGAAPPPPGQQAPSCAAHPRIPVGQGGEAVTDTYYFVHRTLAGNGSITARVGSLSGLEQADSNSSGVSQSQLANPVAGPVQPWSKAGLILATSTKPGSAYAAVLLTGAHGVRLQYDYTHDIAGGSVATSASSKWLRLTRSGATLTGYESTDGIHWRKVGSARLAGLPASVQAGLFVTSPQTAPTQKYLVPGSEAKATGASASFDHLSLEGHWTPASWSGQEVGATPEYPTLTSVGYHPSSGGFTISGSGDIAPAVGLSGGDTDQPSLTGVFVGLIALIVLATMFITVEYRRGLIHTTFSASPHRGRVLAAKAIVIGSVAFLVGLVSAAVALPLGAHILRSQGNYVYPTSTLTELRVILGTAALLAAAAVLALALGTILRRSAGAVTAVIVLIVLPYVLAFVSALPAGVAEWLLRFTPAAAFAVQQTIPQYSQVNYLYTPSEGFYPLAPWAGLGVLCAYAALALGVATYLLRSRDA